MNKQELVKKIAEKANLSEKDSKAALTAFLEATQECLANGDSLTLIGFGTFGTKKRPARKGHNPREPKKTITIPAKNVVRFAAGSTLKQAVNKK
ncbi:MAG: HU family DNA-binding protein [Bacteroidales bacterium]|nr:HU family DNA-binding protein [Bacteroidales bacterium]